MKNIPGQPVPRALAALAVFLSGGCGSYSGPSGGSSTGGAGAPDQGSGWNNVNRTAPISAHAPAGVARLRVETSNGDLALSPGGEGQVSGQARVTASGPYSQE